MMEACRGQAGSGTTLQGGVKQRAFCVICPTGFLPERPRGQQVTAAREKKKEQSAQYVTPLQPHPDNKNSTHTCMSSVKQWVKLTQVM